MAKINNIVKLVRVPKHPNHDYTDCSVPTVQDWKLFTMAQAVLYAVFDSAEETIQIAEDFQRKVKIFI